MEIYQKKGTSSIIGVQIFNLDLDQRGSPRPTLDNFIEIAAQHPDFDNIFSYDEMAGTKMTNVDYWEDISATPRPLRDNDYAIVMRWFERHAGAQFSKYAYAERCVDHLCLANSYDPLIDYLNQCHEQWKLNDSPKVIQHLPLVEMTLTERSAENIKFVSAVLRCWLVSAVARAYDAGCKVDSAIILEGPQGAGKSSFYRALAGDEWFSDSLPPMGSKDASDALRGKWIVELAELSSLKRSETEEVKAFITRQTERYRPAYGKNEVTVPRRCVFGGSTNADNYLRDTTGNRRFWPFSVEKIMFNEIRENRDMIWGEAVDIWNEWATNRMGRPPWLLPKDYEETMAQEQRDRVHVDSWVPNVAEIIKTTIPPHGDFRLHDVADVMDLQGKDLDKAKQMRLADAIKETGLCTKKRDRFGIKYVYSNPETLTHCEEERAKKRDPYFGDNPF